MKWHLYILRCSDSTFYTGITVNLKKRIGEHNTDNARGSKFVWGRRPVKLTYTEVFKTKSAALKREREIKSWPRTKKLELIQ